MSSPPGLSSQSVSLPATRPTGSIRWLQLVVVSPARPSPCHLLVLAAVRNRRRVELRTLGYYLADCNYQFDKAHSSSLGRLASGKMQPAPTGAEQVVGSVACAPRRRRINRRRAPRSIRADRIARLAQTDYINICRAHLLSSTATAAATTAMEQLRLKGRHCFCGQRGAGDAKHHDSGQIRRAFISSLARPERRRRH